MKTKRRVPALLLSLLLVLSLVVGCGQNAAPAETTTAAQETTAAATTEEATSAQETTAEETEAESEADTEAAAQEIIEPDYSDEANWAYLELDKEGDADIFFICPSVYGGSDDACNMPLSDEDVKYSFSGAINMEKGIYDANARFFAPYYQQIGLNVYEMPIEDREPYLEIAYRDVRDAFDYYLENYNNDRPIILAGFSQGADMCIRLMKDCFGDEALADQLVACYAIGWRVTEDEVNEFPQLKMAQGEDDTGVIVCFNSEAEDVTDSLMIPEGMKTYAINPLNWKTDSTPADKSLNKGACFTKYSGEISSEIPELTGAYIDETRGALKVTDVTPEDYPAGLSIFTDGIYHLYDYQFFYRNLQENVQTRIDAYLNGSN